MPPDALATPALCPPGRRLSRALQEGMGWLGTTSIWVSVCAFFGPMCAAWLAGAPADLWVCTAVACLTYAIYAHDRLSTSAEDLTNTPQRALLGQHRGCIHGTIAAALLLAVGLVAWRVPQRLPVLLAPLAVGAFYATQIPGLPRLKALPGVKTPLVTGVTAVAYVGLGPWSWEVFGTLMLVLIIDSVLFDLRDLAGDRAAGVRSLPVLLGPPRTVGLLLVFCGVLLASPLPWIFVLGLALLVVWFRRPRPGWQLDLFVESWRIVLAALLALG